MTPDLYPTPVSTKLGITLAVALLGIYAVALIAQGAGISLF